jgi:high affinity sulfate transporter 1
MPTRRAEPATGLALLRRYERGWLRPDLVAGLTVGAMLVPQSMAYAELAGMPPEVGLYAVVASPVAYALAGTSRHLGTGPEPGTAILAGTGVSTVAGTDGDTDRLALMALLALMVAVIAAAARLARMGFVANLLSKPILVGYITGVGLVLVSSQLAAFTGVPIDADDFFGRFGQLLSRLDQIDGRTLAVAVTTLTVIVALRRWAPRAPGALLGVGGATLVVWLGDVDVPLVGAIPAGLPVPSLPDVGVGDVGALLPAALGITLVGYTDNMLTGRSIGARMGYRIDPDQELAGLGAANLASGLLQGMPVSSSASRSAVPASLGSVTSLVSLVASAVVVVTLLAARDALGSVPRSALAALIVAAALVIIDVAGFRSLWRVSRVELGLAVTTTLGVMVFDVLVGVLVAVALSVVVALGRMARPGDAVLGDRPDLDGWVDILADPAARTLPGLLVYRFDAPLFFVNAERFRERVRAVLDENPGAEEWVVLDFEGIGAVDATAVDVLAELLGELDAEDVAVVGVARANQRTLDRLGRAGLLAPDGPAVVFPTINAAVAAFGRRGGG